MSKIHEVYRCNICGHIIQINKAGAGELVCCNEPMELLEEKTQDTGNEKHVPVIEKTNFGIKVKVGEIEHPMDEAHSIQWIEVISGGRSYKKFLKPGDKPEAEFNTKDENIIVREYCNLHGLWRI